MNSNVPPCSTATPYQLCFVAFEDFSLLLGFGLEDCEPSSLEFVEGLLVVVYFSSRCLQWNHHRGDHLRQSSAHRHHRWLIGLAMLNCVMMTSRMVLGLILAVHHLVMNTLVVDLPLGTFVLTTKKEDESSEEVMTEKVIKGITRMTDYV